MKTAPSKMSRRSFLATAAGTAAATAFHPLAAKAAQAGPAAAKSPMTGKPTAAWRDEGGVINLSNSPHAKIKTVPVRAVVVREGFWSKRRQTNVESSIPSMRDELLEHGRMDNFLRLEGQSNAPQRGPVYSDSDIYKWIEAVGFALQSSGDPALRKATDGMIRQVVATQEPSGYLNTYYVGDRASLRMLAATQETGHELYCIGHLLQGAIAYYRATGDPTLLDAGMRFVDDFLLPNYGPAANQKPIVAGHPEIEMSLIELYRTTGNRKYLDLAGYILRGDDRIPLKQSQLVYMFCGVPFTSRTKNLSVNRDSLSPADQCCGQGEQRDVALFCFLEADQQFSKSVQPGVGSLHDPSSGFVSWLALPGRALFFSLFDVRAIVLRNHGLFGRVAFVTSIGAQMLWLPLAWPWPFAHHGFERPGEQLHIMRVGSTGDDRQWDPTGVDQQAAFAPIFSPCPLGWPQRTALPTAPCPWRHRWTASARRCLPSRHTRPRPPARALRRSLLFAIAENARERRSQSRTRAAAPSTDNRCATHRRSPKRFAARAWAFGLRPACAGRFDLQPAAGWASKARSCSKMRRIRSRT